ncbi:hypothetical protein ACFE04_016955 [Oxalis oulophora]
MSKKRNESLLLSGGIFGPAIKSVNSELKKQAHLYVLLNMVDVVPYIEEHMRLLLRQTAVSRKGLQWIRNEHFPTVDYTHSLSSSITKPPQPVHILHAAATFSLAALIRSQHSHTAAANLTAIERPPSSFLSPLP